MTASSECDDLVSDTRITAGADVSAQWASADFRDYLYDPANEVIARYRGMDAETFARERTGAPMVQQVLDGWRRQYEAPFAGITAAGSVRPNVYDSFDPDALATAEQARMAEAAQGLLDIIDDADRARLSYRVDAPEWRAWSNPEFLVHRVGVRVEHLDPAVYDAVLAVVDATLSDDGAQLVRDAMSLNGFLGELVDLPLVMNDRSYSFALYGDPDPGRPWGWQLFGHHLAVNVLSIADRIVIAPVFVGAEPATVGGAEGSIFAGREQTALALAGSLTDMQRKQAVVYHSVLDAKMPEGRVHPFDERHLGGAFQDNRVIPPEGILALELEPGQQQMLLHLIAESAGLLPAAHRDRLLRESVELLPETTIVWYGPIDGSGPCYFRIQSPIVLAEFDHHAGVWLTNTTPSRFHVHTTFRHPNGNDYGRAYLHRWEENRSEQH